MKKFLLILLIAFTFQACNSPLKEFTLSDGMALQLFSDGTCSLDVRLLERKYNISGTWTGSLSEGSTFTTITKGNGLEGPIITNYKIVNGHAITVGLSKK